MNTKFEVGQVWKTRDGREATIMEIHDVSTGLSYRVTGRLGEGGECWTDEGKWYIGADESSQDLVELVTNADGTPAASPLPLEATHELLTPGVDFVASELKAFEPDARQAFVHGLIRDMAVTAIENGLTFSDVEDGVRGAVNLRDALLKKSD